MAILREHHCHPASMLVIPHRLVSPCVSLSQMFKWLCLFLLLHTVTCNVWAYVLSRSGDFRSSSYITQRRKPERDASTQMRWKNLFDDVPNSQDAPCTVTLWCLRFMEISKSGIGNCQITATALTSRPVSNRTFCSLWCSSRIMLVNVRIL